MGCSMDQHTRFALKEAENLLKAGDVKAAQSLLVSTLQSNPNLEEGWFLLSFTCQKPDQKRYTLNLALQINPNFREAQQELRTIEKLEAQPNIAVGDIDSDDKPSISEAETLIADGNLEATQKVLRDFLGAHPDESQGWYLLSFAEPTWRGQINVLRHSLRIEPGFTAAKTRLAELQQINVASQKAKPALTPSQQTISPKPKKATSSLWGLTGYMLHRGFIILATIVFGIYLTVLITNKGGQIDYDVQRKIDRQIVTLRYSAGFNDMDLDEKKAQLDAIQLEMEEKIGLNLPPILRNMRWTYNALTFQWGKVVYLRHMNLKLGSAEEIDQVKTLILQYLPNTLMLFGTANFLVLVIGIPLALYLASRGKNSRMDRFLSMLSPLSSVPSWVHGILLVTIFAVVLGVLPLGGKYDDIPPETSLGYIPIVAKHMALPVTAIFLSMIFQLIYSWRTYFLIYSDEDYVELARAKGLAPKTMERRYILRPTLPYIITGFALTLVGFWQMSTALEAFFNWPGIGMLYVTSLPHFWGEYFFPGEVSIILSVVALFAFMLGFVVFILDATYAILDPHVRLGRCTE